MSRIEFLRRREIEFNSSWFHTLAEKWNTFIQIDTSPRAQCASTRAKPSQPIKSLENDAGVFARAQTSPLSSSIICYFRSVWLVLLLYQFPPSTVSWVPANCAMYIQSSTFRHTNDARRAFFFCFLFLIIWKRKNARSSVAVILCARCWSIE